VKTNGLVKRVSGSLGREVNWTQAYESRMRRFNLEVVFVALIALVLAIMWSFITWQAFQRSVPLSHPVSVLERIADGRER
jgi:hypothetical protein